MRSWTKHRWKSFIGLRPTTLKSLGLQRAMPNRKHSKCGTQNYAYPCLHRQNEQHTSIGFPEQDLCSHQVRSKQIKKYAPERIW